MWLRRIVETLLPLAVAAGFWTVGWHLMAAVAAGIAVILLALAWIAPEIRKRVDHAVGWFAEKLATCVTALLLALPFFLLMPWIRLWNRCLGPDLLRLRVPDGHTAWLPADGEARRNRAIRRMFCSERIERRGMGLLAWAVLAVMILAGAELGLRLYGMGKPILFVQDPDIGYYPMPNQVARYPGRTVEINSFGMRAGTVLLPKPAGKVRILMIGDSTLAGTKVGNHELYTHHLQERLNRQAGRQVFEVLNMGVNAWGPLHEAAFIEKFGAFDADVAIICGPIANCFRPRYGLERLPFSPSTHPPKCAIEHVGYELMWRFREQILGAPSWAVEGEHQDRQAEVGIQGYVKLGRLFQQAGCEVHLEMLPARPVTLGQGDDPHGMRFFGWVQREMAGIGVTARCAGPIFKDEPNPADIYHDGVHFDVRGHRLYARYLAGQLTQHSQAVRDQLQPKP